jgi:hypothetical protein
MKNHYINDQGPKVNVVLDPMLLHCWECDRYNHELLRIRQYRSISLFLFEMLEAWSDSLATICFVELWLLANHWWWVWPSRVLYLHGRLLWESTHTHSQSFCWSSSRLVEPVSTLLICFWSIVDGITGRSLALAMCPLIRLRLQPSFRLLTRLPNVTDITCICVLL